MTEVASDRGGERQTMGHRQGRPDVESGSGGCALQGSEREKAAIVKASQETARVVGEAEERGGQHMLKEVATKATKLTRCKWATKGMRPMRERGKETGGRRRETLAPAQLPPSRYSCTAMGQFLWLVWYFWATRTHTHEKPAPALRVHLIFSEN